MKFIFCLLGLHRDQCVKSSTLINAPTLSTAIHLKCERCGKLGFKVVPGLWTDMEHVDARALSRLGSVKAEA